MQFSSRAPTQKCLGSNSPVRPAQDGFEAGRSRVAIKELKKRLVSYFAEERHEKWRCFLPNAKTAGGYKLIFSPARKPATATENFWNVHLNAALDPIVITGSHLFFFDTKIDRIIRYYDFNHEGNVSAEETLEKLKVAHPECITETLEPWRDVYLGLVTCTLTGRSWNGFTVLVTS